MNQAERGPRATSSEQEELRARRGQWGQAVQVVVGIHNSQ
jgi:hypothetical protein